MSRFYPTGKIHEHLMHAKIRAFHSMLTLCAV